MLLCDLVRTALARGSAHLTLEVRWATSRPSPSTGASAWRRWGCARTTTPDGGDALVMWVRDIDTGEYAQRLSAIEASLAPDVTVERRA